MFNPYRSFMQKEAMIPYAAQQAADKALDQRFGDKYRKAKEVVGKGIDAVVAKTTREVSPEYMQAIKSHMEPQIEGAVKYHDIKVPMMGKMLAKEHADAIQAPIMYGAEPGVNNVWAHPTRSPAVMAHELGHATKGNVLSEANKKLRVPTALMQQYLPAIAKMNPAFGESKAYKVLTGVAHAPTLAEEARATFRGLKGIKQVHGTKEMLKAVPTLTAAYGSYAGQALKALKGGGGAATESIGSRLLPAALTAGKALLRR